MKHLDAVSHAQHGLGRVLFAKLGFPKVKVQFPGGALKVPREELTVASSGGVAARPRFGGAKVAVPAAAEEARALIHSMAEVVESWRTELGELPALPGWRRRRHYELAEVELVYLVAKSPENAEALARLLGRGVPAIDLLWRWCDGANFPDRAQNEIARQVEIVRERLGDKARGSCERVPCEFMLLGRGGRRGKSRHDRRGGRSRPPQIQETSCEPRCCA